MPPPLWASQPQITETGWKDLSGGCVGEDSSRGYAQPLAEMANVADERLFRVSTRFTTDLSHVLKQLLPKPRHTVMIWAREHMSMSLMRRTNIISYLACCIKTSIVRNDEERGPPIVRLDSYLIGLLSLLYYNYCLGLQIKLITHVSELSCGCVSCIDLTTCSYWKTQFYTKCWLSIVYGLIGL